MKIAQLIPHFDKLGGIQVCIHNISERIARKGHQVHILCKAHLDSNARYSYDKITFIHFKFSPINYFIGQLWAHSYVAVLQKKHQYDLWQINGGYPYGTALASYFQSRHLPAVLRCSGEDIQTDRDIGYGVRLNPKIDCLVKENYKKYSSLVAISETVKNEYLSIGVSESNIALIPNGVDVDRIAGRNRLDEIRVKHNIPSQSKVILSVGRNHPKKRYGMIPSVLKKLIDKGIDAYWIVIGRGCTRIDGSNLMGEELHRLILIEAISFEKGKFDIPSDELIDYYKCADVFAMTSYIETFGIVLIEAMASGTPVVCFDVPGVRDVMNAEFGIICDSGNEHQFVEAIAKITSSKESNTISDQHRQYTKKFSWDSITEKYLSLYESLVM